MWHMVGGFKLMKEELEAILLKLILAPAINQKTKQDLCTAWVKLQRREYFQRRLG